MPRTNRIAPGGWVFHVLNRGNAGGDIFADEGDYRAFERLLRETGERFRMRLLAWMAFGMIPITNAPGCLLVLLEDGLWMAL